MSRISDGKLDRMTDKILADLYVATEKKLADKAVEIAKNSRQCWINPYEPLLKQLPDELIAKTLNYNVTIKYPWNREFVPTDIPDTTSITQFVDSKMWEDIDYIQENWKFTSPTPIVNPCSFNNYGSTTAESQQLHPDMYEDAETLCKEKIKLLQEKARMQNYLDASISKNRTHKQLREVLPSSLHRYLPPETVKRKAIKKEARHVETPNFLGERQTINLLEDN